MQEKPRVLHPERMHPGGTENCSEACLGRDEGWDLAQAEMSGFPEEQQQRSLARRNLVEIIRMGSSDYEAKHRSPDFTRKARKERY